MTPKKLSRPRKTATQARSRVTVDALVEATARILVRDGFDGASTNRIAEEAGVSIGSLYQYFPGKEALVAAVAERHSQDLTAIVHEAFARSAGKPLEAGIRLLITAAIEAHRVHPALHRVLAEQTPRSAALAEAELFGRNAYALFRSFLEDHRDALSVCDLDMAAFLCVTSIEALTHSAVIHRPETLADGKVDRLVAEVSHLILGYLRAPSRSPRLD